MLLVSLVLSAALFGAGDYLGGIVHIPALTLQTFNLIVSFVGIFMLFAIIFKVLPDVQIEWKDVRIGGAVTSFLFSLGKYMIGLYLGRCSVTSVFGATGSFMVILILIYYSRKIYFFGAGFTQVYAN